MFDMTNAELLQVQSDTASTLTSLVESLNERADMMELLQELMGAENPLTTVAEMGLEDPETTRLTIQACVTALVNLQGNRAVKDELQRRADQN